MKKVALVLGLPFVALGSPQFVYDPPDVMKFEVYVQAGKPYYTEKELKDKRDYVAFGGFDWRVGYPFLAGLFYMKENDVDGVGGRAKVRLPLFWKVKWDFYAGALYQKDVKERGVFLVGTEPVIFVNGGFSLKLGAGYFFGSKEVERWSIYAGFGF